MEDMSEVTTQTKSKSKLKVAVAVAGVLAAAAIIGYLSLRLDLFKIKDPATIKDPSTMYDEGNLPPIYVNELQTQ